MNKKPKLILNQKIYATDTRINASKKLVIGTVIRIGRKYFTVKLGGYWEPRFHLDTWKEQSLYNSSITLYETEQDYHDQLEKTKHVRDIYESFKHLNRHTVDKFSLDQLRRIKLIIDEPEAPAERLEECSKCKEMSLRVINENEEECSIKDCGYWFFTGNNENEK